MTDAPLVPISAIEHFVYCRRQCALIHCDGVWSDNVHTVKGSRAHRRVDGGRHRRERGRLVLRAIPLWSETLGLSGRADAVEIEPATDADLPPANGGNVPAAVPTQRRSDGVRFVRSSTSPVSGMERRRTCNFARRRCASRRCSAWPCPRATSGTAGRGARYGSPSRPRFATRFDRSSGRSGCSFSRPICRRLPTIAVAWSASFGTTACPN